MLPKILIIRFSSIGDIVLTTPVIRAVKQQFNEGNNIIHFLTKKSFFPVLKANPYIDKLYGIDLSTSEIINKLKEEDYDYIIDLHNNIRSLQVKRKLKRIAFTFDKINFEKWLMVNFKINRLPQKHIVDRYFEAVAPLEIKNDQKGLDYFIPKEEEFPKEQMPEKFKNGYIAFAIGGTYSTKRLPEDKIINICNRIKRPVVLLGGKTDELTGSKIANRTSANVWNTCGKLSLNESASLIKQAQKVIAHDTGLMHIAAAFNKPVASVWGNTIPQFGMYPYEPQTPENVQIFEVNGLRCRPCSKLGYNKCPKKHFYCMNLQEVDAIADWANL